MTDIIYLNIRWLVKEVKGFLIIVFPLAIGFQEVSPCFKVKS